MTDLVRDLVHGLRLLRRNPAFAAIAVFTLALGIGANSALFSLVNAVLLRPLPYADPDRLFVVYGQRDGRSLGRGGASQPDAADWKEGLDGVARLATLSYWTFNMSGREVPERVLGVRVSGEFFDVMGTAPRLGRALRPEDDRPEATPVAVLSEAFWRKAFAADAGIVGRAIVLEGTPHVVVGVMPARFTFPGPDVEAWLPFRGELRNAPRDARFLLAVARLGPAVAPRAAQSALDVVAARLAAAYPDTNRGAGARLVPAHESLVGDVRPALLVLWAGVGLVLLVAVANVSSLLIARGTVRRREMAIRAALGAGRAAVVRQLVAENLVLAGAGTVLGLAVARATLPLLRAFAPADLPRLDEIRLDLPVLLFAAGLALLTAVLLGLVSAFQSIRRDPRPDLQGSQRVGTSRSRSRLQRTLVVAELAIALTLAVAGGLLMRSVRNLLAVSPGFEADRVASLSVFLTPPRYLDLESQRAYVRRALAALEEVPGVAAVGSSSHLPLQSGATRLKLAVEGCPYDRAQAPAASYRVVSPAYFRAMGIPLREGRLPADSDDERAPLVAVVNEAMARELWPGESPLGRRLRWVPEAGPGGAEARWHTVIGMVADVHDEGLDAVERPAAYVPFPQRVLPFVRGVSFVVRTPRDPASLLPALRRALLQVDPEQPAFDVESLATFLDGSTEARRFPARLLQLFAGLALVLAAVGTYGVLSYVVLQRTREIGVRMALGATPERVRREVLGEGLRLVSVGLVLGLPMALGSSRFLRGMLFGVGPDDPLTMGAASAVLVAAALLAAAVPARRATRVDPIVALRGE